MKKLIFNKKDFRELGAETMVSNLCEVCRKNIGLIKDGELMSFCSEECKQIWLKSKQ